MKNAQLFSMEGVLSITLFIIIIFFVLSFWNVYSSRLSAQVVSEELQLQAAHISDLLVQSRGFPDSWENDPTTLMIPGLMQNPGSLHEKKLSQFLALDYATLKKLLNIERFDIEFQIRDESGNMLNSTGASPSSADEAVVFQRLVLVNNQTRQVFITVW